MKPAYLYTPSGFESKESWKMLIHASLSVFVVLVVALYYTTFTSGRQVRRIAYTGDS